MPLLLGPKHARRTSNRGPGDGDTRSPGGTRLLPRGILGGPGRRLEIQVGNRRRSLCPLCANPDLIVGRDSSSVSEELFNLWKRSPGASFSQQGPKRIQSIDRSACACCCRLSAPPERWHFGTRIHGKKPAPALGTSCPPAHSRLGKEPPLSAGRAGRAVGSWGTLPASHPFPGLPPGQ